jgi:hypothetical protein
VDVLGNETWRDEVHPHIAVYLEVNESLAMEKLASVHRFSNRIPIAAGMR